MKEICMIVYWIIESLFIEIMVLEVYFFFNYFKWLIFVLN